MTLTHESPGTPSTRRDRPTPHPPPHPKLTHPLLPRTQPLRPRPLHPGLARPAPASHRRPRPPVDRRRQRLGLLGWRVAVSVGGALLLVVASAMALGIVTVTPSGLRFGEPGTAPRTDGSDGSYPGGPAVRVPVTVRNPMATSLEITAIRPALSALPATCPASVWDVGAPDRLPTLPARGEAVIPLPVTLAAGAPDSCQGLMLRVPVTLDALTLDALTGDTLHLGVASAAVPGGPAERSMSLEAEADLTVAVLGSPGARIAVEGDHLTLTPVRPSGGPTPTGYDILRQADGSRLCSSPASAAGSGPACPDPSAAAASRRNYVVVARLGTGWERAAPPVGAWTPPPTPALVAATSASRVVLSSGQGANAYEVALFADSTPTPFAVEPVPAAGVSDLEVTLPRLRPGLHRLVAVARFHGWQVPSETLLLTRATDGSTVAGPFEAPAPVGYDPAPLGVTLPGPAQVDPLPEPAPILASDPGLPGPTPAASPSPGSSGSPPAGLPPAGPQPAGPPPAGAPPAGAQPAGPQSSVPAPVLPSPSPQAQGNGGGPAPEPIPSTG